MNIRGAPDLPGQPSDDPSSGGERERIRQRMKMVIGQLEDILQELKEVAKELREVRVCWRGCRVGWLCPHPCGSRGLVGMCVCLSVSLSRVSRAQFDLFP